MQNIYPKTRTARNTMKKKPITIKRITAASNGGPLLVPPTRRVT